MTIRLTAVADAVRAERTRAIEILEACATAGRPDLAADFVGGDMTPAEVRATLSKAAPSAPAPAAQPRASSGFDVRAIEAALAEKRERPLQ